MRKIMKSVEKLILVIFIPSSNSISGEIGGAK